MKIVGGILILDESAAVFNCTKISSQQASSPRLRNNSSIACSFPSDAKIILTTSVFSRSRASANSCSFWNVKERKSCGVSTSSKSRSNVCLISTAIRESIPISDKVVPNETDFRSRIPIIFITVSTMLSLPERPTRFSATTILATMASGTDKSLSNSCKHDEIRCCKVPPISISILSSAISATRPTSPTAPHCTALAG
ncbi:hypothetical protein FF38_13057 [Lucilia cuprina]|uniref:Uncharacterized protein n=1 Tax=Lucilia cuprina TaxID=7375 RepID=A0A0L0BN36_LUCCU|nr:hypothetical protein FF38_13057 [Lucilia cuprina]